MQAGAEIGEGKGVKVCETKEKAEVQGLTLASAGGWLGSQPLSTTPSKCNCWLGKEAGGLQSGISASTQTAQKQFSEELVVQLMG